MGVDLKECTRSGKFTKTKSAIGVNRGEEAQLASEFEPKYGWLHVTSRENDSQVG